MLCWLATLCTCRCTASVEWGQRARHEFASGLEAFRFAVSQWLALHDSFITAHRLCYVCVHRPFAALAVARLAGPCMFSVFVCVTPHQCDHTAALSVWEGVAMRCFWRSLMQVPC
jgi:hypothetical protein